MTQVQPPAADAARRDAPTAWPAPAWLPLTSTSRSVALEVLLHGPLSRSELARRLGLSAGTLTRLAKPLLEDGLLVEDGRSRDPGTGRPARPLDVVADAHHFIGVRLTSTQATAVVTDLRACVVASTEARLDDTSPEAVVATIARLVAELCTTVPATSVGIALGGQVRASSTVLRAPFLGWDEVPLADLVQEATGLPVTVENDVVSLTTAEHWFGSGRGRDDFAVVTVGVGVGCGLVTHGQVAAGDDAGVGLLGHQPLGLPAPLCHLGHRGCAEGVLTDASILNQASAAFGRPVVWGEMLDLAAAAHPVAQALLEDFAVGLGRLVALVGNVSTVPLVIVSGESVGLARLVEGRVRAVAAAERDPAANELELTFQPAPAEEWASGAAAVALRRYVSTDHSATS